MEDENSNKISYNEYTDNIKSVVFQNTNKFQRKPQNDESKILTKTR